MYAVVVAGRIVRTLAPSRAFTLGKNQYASNWLALSTEEDRRALGIYQVVGDEEPNERYFTVTDRSYAFDAENGVVNAVLATAPKELAGIKDRMIADLAAQRYRAEVQGFTWNGAFIATDREARGNIAGSALAAKVAKDDGEPFSANWKAGGGVWIALDADQMIAIGKAVRDYVQSVFDHEMELAAEIEAAESVEDLQVIDITAGWPTA